MRASQPAPSTPQTVPCAAAPGARDEHIQSLGLLCSLRPACLRGGVRADSSAVLKQFRALPEAVDSEARRAQGRLSFSAAEFGAWDVQVDTAALRSVRGPSAITHRQLSAPAAGQSMPFDLPYRGQIWLETKRLSESRDGILTMSGAVRGYEDSEFRLTTDPEGTLLARIRIGANLWLLRPVGSTHVLRWLDVERMEIVPDEPVESTRSLVKKPGLASAKTGGNGRVDVLFLYGTDVSSPGSIASAVVSDLNDSLSNSGLASNYEFVVADVQSIGDDFDAVDKEVLIYEMINRDPPFDDLMSDRMFEANADIAVLLISTDPGMPDFGRVGGIAAVFNSESPFAITTDDYAVGDLTGPHEIGHVLDGRHENYPSGTNIGHTHSACSWQTIMGGYVNCSFTGLPPTTPRIEHFSNLNVSYSGDPTGVTAVSNMAAHLANTMIDASSWRDDGDPAAPGAPGSISNNPELCYGANTLSWSSVGGASDYRLYESDSSGFSSSSVVYSGSSTSTIVSVPAFSTRYYRARACNSKGCSNFTTSTASASYFNGCL